MKTKRFFLLAHVLFASQFCLSQDLTDLNEFMKAEKADANRLLASYISPALNAISNGTNTGWYTTAKTHKPLGFDLGVSLSAVFVPSSDNYFTPSLTNTTFNNTTNPGAGAPTVFGPKDLTRYTSSYDPDGNGPLASQSISFDGPEGLDLSKNVGFGAMLVPILQVGIGTIKNTDLKIRYVPEIKKESSGIKMFGIAVMHSPSQYMGKLKEMPFDLAVLASYNSVSANSSLVSTTSVVSNDGNLNMKFSSWTIQALISKKLSVLTLYAAAGYGSVNSTADITGTFTFNANQEGSSPISVTNPLAMSVDNSGARLTGGLRVKLGPFYVNGDYTLQKYNTLTVGTGLAIR